MLLTSVFLHLFRNNKYKKTIIIFSCCFLISLWPAILRNYFHRYIYHAIPLYALIIGLLCVGYQHTLKFHRSRTHFAHMACCFLSFLFFFNAFFITKHIKAKEKSLVTKLHACQDLLQSLEKEERPLLFLALPIKLFKNGAAQTMWMLGANKSTPIYYGTNNFIAYKQQIKNPRITKINHGFRIQLNDNTNQAYFINGMGIDNNLGEKTINNVDAKNGNAVDISYKIHNKYWEQYPIFITWDYEKKKFKILSHPEQVPKSTNT